MAALAPILALGAAALFRRPEASSPPLTRSANPPAPVVAAPPPAPLRVSRSSTTEPRLESAPVAPHRHLIATAENPGDVEARKVALYDLAARDPGREEITRSLIALTAPEQPSQIRIAAYTAFRFRRNDPIAADALLRAFPGAPEPERLAAANSLAFQRVPGLADRVQVIAASEPSAVVRAALDSTLDHLLDRVRTGPCLLRTNP